MSSGVAKSQILSIYKQLLRESEKFSGYNYRCYALRRIRDAFRENKSLSSQEQIGEQLKYAKDNLDIIKRQVIIGNLYSTDKLVIETEPSNTK